jgi:hypothetical protein
MMKRAQTILLLLIFLCGVPMTAHALPILPGDPFTFNFDEFGNGSISVNGGAFTSLSGSLLADPSQPGNPLVLTYILPASVTLVGAGTVQIHDGPLTTDPIGDALRFTNAAGALTGQVADRMIFYSLLGGGAPADTGLPSNLTAGNAAIPIFERANGAFTFDGPNIYNGMAEPLPTVPEPASVLLLGTGLIGAGVRRCRRRPQ